MGFLLVTAPVMVCEGSQGVAERVRDGRIISRRQREGVSGCAAACGTILWLGPLSTEIIMALAWRSATPVEDKKAR